jgi:hypothetical protein
LATALYEINEINEFYAINAVREWMNGLLDGWIMKNKKTGSRVGRREEWQMAKVGERRAGD